MSHFQEITCLIMYLTKFQEADWLSRWQFQRQFHKTQAISDSKLGWSLNISVIGQLRRDRMLSQSKYRIWASLGGNFLFWVRFVVLFLVAKWPKSKDFIVQTLNILKVSSTQVRIKTRRTAQETGWNSSKSGQLKEKRKLTWKNMLQRNWTVHFVSFLQNLERLMVMTMSWMFSAIDIWNPRITPNQPGKTIFFSLAAKFWKERPESYVLKVKRNNLTVLNVWTLRKKKFYGNVYSLGLSHQNP